MKLNENDEYDCLIKIHPKIDKFIVLDTETTGLSKKDHIIEIGCYLADMTKLIKKFRLYIKPRVKMNKHINKLSNLSIVINKINFSGNTKNYLLQFLDFVNGYLIISHRAVFDHEKINMELKYWGLPQIPLNRFRCTLRLFKYIIPKTDKAYEETSKSLKNCCLYLGIQISNKKLHRALYDSSITYQLFIKLFNKLYNNTKEERILSNNKKTNNVCVNENNLINENSDMITKLFQELQAKKK